MATHLKFLAILDIGYCSEVTDEGFFHFKEAKPKWNFIELTLSGLTKVSNKGFHALLETCEETL